MLQEVIDRADKWGDDGRTGRIDPFTEVYDVSPLPFGNIRCFVGGVESFLSACFCYDCPHDRMSRPDEERNRSQEDRRFVHDLPDQWNSHLFALALAPQLGEEGGEGGHH